MLWQVNEDIEGEQLELLSKRTKKKHKKKKRSLEASDTEESANDEEQSVLIKKKHKKKKRSISDMGRVHHSAWSRKTSTIKWRRGKVQCRCGEYDWCLDARYQH